MANGFAIVLLDGGETASIPLLSEIVAEPAAVVLGNASVPSSRSMLAKLFAPVFASVSVPLPLFTSGPAESALAPLMV